MSHPADHGGSNCIVTGRAHDSGEQCSPNLVQGQSARRIPSFQERSSVFLVSVEIALEDPVDGPLSLPGFGSVYADCPSKQIPITEIQILGRPAIGEIGRAHV